MARGAAAKTSGRRIRSTEKGRRALELRKQGLSYTKIAAEIGCARSTAHLYVSRELEALAQTCHDEAEQVRDLEIHRLDDLYMQALQHVQAGEIPAIDRCLRIMERRAKLLGLDAPEQINHSGTLTWQEVVESACGDHKD